MMKLTCERVYAVLMDFSEATLPAQMHQSVRAHLGSCKACSRMVETFDKTRSLCHTLLEQELPKGAGDRLIKALRDKLLPRG